MYSAPRFPAPLAILVPLLPFLVVKNRPMSEAMVVSPKWRIASTVVVARWWRAVLLLVAVTGVVLQ